MLNLKKITTTVSLLSLGALSVALFSTGCDSGSSNNGTGGAGGKSSIGGAGGTATGGAAGGHGGAATGGAAGGHGGTASGGAAGGHGGSATGGVCVNSTGGAGGTQNGGAGGTENGGHGGAATGGAAGGTAGSAGGSAGSAGGAGGEANIMYQIMLTGAMEVLPSGTAASTAMGSATVVLNPNTGAVSVQGSFTGLSAAASGAHIHGPAAVNAEAGVIVALTASPATAGAISGSGTLTAQQVMDMKNGLTYVNVHSSGAYAGGEIRGQIHQ